MEGRYEGRFTSLTETELFAMAIIRPDRTGLDMVIFVSCGIGLQHGPRKVATTYGPKLTDSGE